MKVIVAIDDSPYSADVIHEVTRRHWPRDTQFKILRVIEPVSWEEFGKGKWAEVVGEAHARRREDALHLCTEAKEKFDSNIPESVVHYEIRKGSPKTEIVDAAVEWSADKILLGAHGNSVCPRFILGSVSRSVAAQAPCSVEIIRPRHRHHKTDASAKSVSLAKHA